MLKHVTHVNVWVHDLDEALAFYTEKLGFEVREDVTMDETGGYRWGVERKQKLLEIEGRR